MKPRSYDMVREFHEKFGHPVGDGAPSLEGIPEKTLKLRMDLIGEEFFELVGAMYSPQAREFMEKCWEEMYDRGLEHREEGGYTADVVEVADALGDMEYVINGLALVAGIPLPTVMAEIHSSNMSKLGEDGNPIYRGDGKILKGPGYFKPDIAAAMGLKERGSNPTL